MANNNASDDASVECEECRCVGASLPLKKCQMCGRPGTQSAAEEIAGLTLPNFQDKNSVDIEKYMAENFPGRGRPRLPEDMRRRDKIIIALTAAEYKAVMITAASVDGKPMRVQDWARMILIAATKK